MSKKGFSALKDYVVELQDLFENAVTRAEKAENRIAELEAEVKMLRVDAERYWCLRDNCEFSITHDWVNLIFANEIDAAIDAAREGKMIPTKTYPLPAIISGEITNKERIAELEAELTMRREQAEGLQNQWVKDTQKIVALETDVKDLHADIDAIEDTLSEREDLLKRVTELATENAILRLLINEAIITMSHAEIFIESREKMHPTGVNLWGDLLDRMAIAIEPEQECGNESMKSIGGV